MNSDRLFNWHGSLFPTGRSGLQKIAVGQWRGDEYGPMQVVSGPLGRERVHFEAPPAQRIDKEMEAYWKWFNSSHGEDSILAAGIGHLWFVTIHPFEDGNGRLARALTEILLCRSDSSPLRFYSMSNQIETHRKNYYLKLETAQKGELDITEWLLWFMQELHGALKFSDNILENVVQKTHFWELLRERRVILNSRQTKMIQALLEGFKGKLSSSKYAKFCNCSQDTALRDLQDLMIKGVVVQSEQGGRSTSYEFNLKK